MNQLPESNTPRTARDSKPMVALFQAIGTAIADFVAKVDEAELAALAGGAWVAPSNTATIA